MKTIGGGGEVISVSTRSINYENPSFKEMAIKCHTESKGLAAKHMYEKL